MRCFRITCPSAIAAAVLALLWLSGTTPARADLRDSFETPQTTWRLIGRDCDVMRLEKHQRVFQLAHSGQGCEYLRLVADFGTHVHFGLAAPPGLVIDEMNISLWVRASRPGIQLLAGVVLPRSRDSRDGSPRRAVLRGSLYQDVGQWQQLSLAQPLQQLKRQESSLRFEYGPDLDIREAYVDWVMINAYGCPGETELWMDDLELSGFVAATGSLITDADQAASTAEATLPPLRIEGSQLLAGERPVFLRVIEYNGESLEWLKKLGFNAVRMVVPPPRHVIDEARGAGLWLMAPPTQDGIEQSDVPAAVWDLGEPISAETVGSLRRTAHQLREAHPSSLTACCPRTAAATLGRAVDLVIFDVPGAGTSHELAHAGDWLRNQIEAAVVSGPFLAALDTQPPDALHWQWQALGFTDTSFITISPDQLRLAAYHAAGTGARGIVFRSYSRLDGGDSAARLRSRTLEWLNSELRIIEPWTAGGRAAGRVDVGDPRIQGYAIDAQHAQLLLLCRSGDEQQFAVPAYVDEPLRLNAPTVAASTQTYLVTSAGLQPVRSDRVAGATQFQVEHLGMVGLAVLSHENLVLDRITQLAAEQRQRRRELELDVLGLLIERAEQLASADRTTRSDELRQQIVEAAALLDRSRQLGAAGDFRAAEWHAHRAANQLAAAERRSWEQAARSFSSPSASPCCRLVPALPLHDTLVGRLQGRTWSGNALAAGGMEDLNHLLNSGWRRETIDRTDVNCAVQLSFDGPRTGRSSLQLQAVSNSRAPRAFDQPLIEIHSAAVPVRAGQLIQIRGWARMPRDLERTTDGLLIYDSLAGPGLAERITAADGWREWTLYRAPLSDGQLVLYFALTGLGEVWIDDVSVQIVDLP
jgi:hypothetical protein